MKKQVKKAVATAQETTNAQSANAQKLAQLAKEAVSDSAPFLAGVAEDLRTLSSVVRAIFERAEKAREIDRARVMLIACGDGNAEFDTSAKTRTAFAKAVRASARWVDSNGRELKRVRVGADLYRFEELRGWSPALAYKRALRMALGVAVVRSVVDVATLADGETPEYFNARGERVTDRAYIAREISAWDLAKADRALASAEKRAEDARLSADFAVIVEGK